jgi:hypothetical protein
MEAGMKVKITALTVLVFLGVAAVPSLAQRPGFGSLYYNDEVVRTVVPPAAAPMAGRDDFYAVPDQLGVAGVAPGDLDYHGGQWAFHSVEWNVAPYLLTSEAAVLEAAAAGDVTIIRLPENDFKCPIQP